MRFRSSFYLLWAVLCSLTFGRWVTFGPNAHALPGFFAGKDDAPRKSSTTQVVLMMNGQQTIVTVLPEFQGPAKPFALVLPVPADVQESDIKTLKRESVERLDELTAPRFHEFWEMDPCEQGEVQQLWERDMSAKSDTDFLGMGDMFLQGTTKAPKEMQVEVEPRFRDEGSEYQFSVVPSNVEAWLTGKGYKIPAGINLSKYSGMAWLVAETDPQKSEIGKRGEALLSAIRFSTKQPVKLAETLGLAQTDTHELLVYAIHPKDRFEVANYKNVFAPTNLEVDFKVKERIGEFYAGLHDAVLAKDPKSVVTEYAWDSKECGQPCVNAPVKLAELLTFGADILEREVPEELRNPKPPERTDEEKKAYKALKKDERKRADELAKEVARRKGLIERQGNFALSRLHFRYNKASLTDDLEFKPAPPVTGGIDAPKGPEATLPLGTATGAKSQFQTRYVSMHPNKVVVKCENPQPFRWGKPPRTYRGANKIWVANQLATRDRALFKPAEVVLKPYEPLGLPGAKALQAAAAASASAAPAEAAGGGICSFQPGANGASGAFFAFCALAYFARRRRARGLV
jgi:hypothetical protein